MVDVKSPEIVHFSRSGNNGIRRYISWRYRLVAQDGWFSAIKPGFDSL